MQTSSCYRRLSHFHYPIKCVKCGKEGEKLQILEYLEIKELFT